MSYEVRLSSGLVVRADTALEVRELHDVFVQRPVLELAPMEASSATRPADELPNGGRKRVDEGASGEGASGEGSKLARVLREHMHLFDRLNPRQRRLVELKIEGRTSPEIASTCEMTVGHVAGTLSKLAKHLQLLSRGSREHHTRTTTSKTKEEPSEDPPRPLRPLASSSPRSAADTLVVEHIEWAMSQAVKFCRKKYLRIEVEDAIGEAEIALVQAARRFDPNRGIPFKAWATRRIQGAIIDFARNQDPAGRHQRIKEKEGVETKAARRGLPVRVLGDIVDLEAMGKLGEGLRATQDVSAQVREVLDDMKKLPPRVREVLERHFVNDESLLSIAKSWGVTESRVCQLAGEARQRLLELRPLPANDAA